MHTPVSVILCTHNPRHDYLDRVLQRLRAQTLPLDRWELLIVDNASAEPLAPRWRLSWHPRARHVREETLGLTYARLRGIDEASGELLVFLDDDNLPAQDFLAVAVELHARNPHLGVFGAGRLEPEFESAPAAELAPYLHLLALRTVERERWSNNAKDHGSMPWGAGLCVTRVVAKTYRDFLERLDVSRIIGRRGEELFCGEDDLFSMSAVNVNKGFGVFPELRIVHMIQAKRLTRPYILRLIRGHAFSHGVLGFVLFGARPRGGRWTGYPRLALHGIRYGHFSLRCKWAAARGERLADRFIVSNDLRCRGDVIPLPVDVPHPAAASRAPAREAIASSPV